MIALIQRVSQASVMVNEDIIGRINQGLLVLLAVEKDDDQQKVEHLCHRILNYRIFNDDNGKMNLNVQQVNGSLLLVSQFTLAADTKKGLRPSFSNGASPQKALELYQYAISYCQRQGIHVETGQFAAEMQVSLINDGPATFLLTN